MTCLNINILSQHSLHELRNTRWEEEVIYKIRILLQYSLVRIKQLHGNANYEICF
jgi:hypothetical protein